MSYQPSQAPYPPFYSTSSSHSSPQPLARDLFPQRDGRPTLPALQQNETVPYSRTQFDNAAANQGPRLPPLRPASDWSVASERPPLQPLPPALPPLPESNDADLHHPPTVAAAIGAKPASRVGGVRQKARARKRKAIAISNDDDGDDDGPNGGSSTRRGRPTGAGNYTTEDVTALNECVDRVLPMGQNGWAKVHGHFKVWAKKNGRPVRDVKSLEAKFKSMVKTRKATGTAVRPAHLTRAKEIDDEINRQAGTRDVEDEEGEEDEDGQGSDEDGGNESSEVEVSTATSKRVRTGTVRSDRTAVLTARHTRGGPAAELVNKLNGAFDPAVQRARDGERALHSFQTSQLQSYSEQLRDAQTVAERLRAENLALLQRVGTVERERDLAQLELRLGKGGQVSREAPVAVRTSRSSRKQPRRSHFKGYPGLDRVGGKVKVVETFPKGGSHTYWVTDPSTDASSAEEYSDSDKENRPPRASRWRDRSPFPHHRPPPKVSSSSSATRVEGHSSPRKPLTSPQKVLSPQASGSSPRSAPLSYQTSQDI